MSIGRGAPAAIAAALLAVAAVGCAPQTDAGPPPTSFASADPSPTASVPASAPLPDGAPVDVVTGLDVPWSVVFVDGVALVSERDTGRIVELGGDGSTRDVGVVDGVLARGEGGLLGLAVRERSLYVYATTEDGNRIERYPLEGAAGSFALGPARTLLDGIPSAGNHNGGRLAFGPDGMLYATTGDAQERDAAQDPDTVAGKILRMTPDGAVPADNPFPGSLVYSYGHRNAQGLAWADDGTMFATEFGQDTWDELNVIVPGGNYGWPDVEGVAGDDAYIDPVQQWAPSEASPSGMAHAGGTLFVANLRGEVLRAVPVADPATSVAFYAGEFGRLRDAVIAPDGALWLLTNNTDGRGAPRGGDDRLLRMALHP